MNYLTSFSSYIVMINEGLIKTINGLKTRNLVKTEMDLMGNYNFDINYIKEINKIELTLMNFNLYDLNIILDHINSMLINRYGWFPAIMRLVNWSGMKNEFSYDEEYLVINKKYSTEVTIIFESKYDIEQEMPKKLYHLSIQEFNNKVIKQGIIPKSKSKLSKHLDRIYVCANKDDCKDLIGRMKMHYFQKESDEKKLGRNSNRNKKWVIYEINTDDLDIKLYKDPNFINGYYIIDNIPPDKIEIILEE